MTKSLLFALVLVASSLPCIAQHDDSPDNSPWIIDVHNDHDNGFCDNISGHDGGKDIDCLDVAPSSPREWDTNCFDPNQNNGTVSDMGCSAYAVVYCPGLGTGSSPGKDYLSFVCTASAAAEVRSGILVGGGWPMTKGVYCRNGVTGMSVSCGCTVHSTTSATFFGSPVPLTYPNQYLCGDV